MATDRRVQRTRKLLREALMMLILEKGYDAITVQDITDRANLGRATLYLHYRDKEDLLFSSLAEVVDELKEKVMPVLPLRDAQSPFEVIFHHAEENADLYRVLLSGQGAATLMIRLREYITQVIRETMVSQHPEFQELVPLEVASSYVSGAVLMLLEWWLRKDIPYTAEQMSEWAWQLILSNLMASMGLASSDFLA